MLYVDDPKAHQDFMQIKYKNKVRLAKYIKEHNGIDVDPNLSLMYRLRDFMNIRDSYLIFYMLCICTIRLREILIMIWFQGHLSLVPRQQRIQDC